MSRSPVNWELCCLRGKTIEETICEFYITQELSVEKVAKRLGVCPTVLYRKFDELGISRQRKKKTAAERDEKIRQRFLEAFEKAKSEGREFERRDVNCRAIARTVGLSPSSIRAHWKRFKKEKNLPW